MQVSFAVSDLERSLDANVVAVDDPTRVGRAPRPSTCPRAPSWLIGDWREPDGAPAATPEANLHQPLARGTGRFAGATGSFTVQRQFDPATGTTTGSFEGTISSPGAGKS